MSPDRGAHAAFEAGASGYEAWYETAAGRRAEEAERVLVTELLAACGAARSILEVGCGTGRFTRWLAAGRWAVYGLDRSPAMLAEFRRLGAGIPAALGDAHMLPVRSQAVDVVLFVTTLEFVDDPRRALHEAARVAREGVVVVALNRISIGALRRRLHGGPILRRARDLSRGQLRGLLTRASGARLRSLHAARALHPAPLAWLPPDAPGSEVIGAAAVLDPAGL